MRVVGFKQFKGRARDHAATSAISGASNASSISSFNPNQVLDSQSSIGQQSVSVRQGLVRIVTSVGGSSAILGGKKRGTEVYLDEDLPDSVDDNDNSDKDEDNDGVGIDEDNNDDDEAGEYVNTSRLCELPAGCLLHSVNSLLFVPLLARI